jgi:hypothetical protein
MEFGDAPWRKSSFSTDGADCIEIAYPDWRKSSFSGTETECVEIAYLATETAVGIRDSKSPAGGHLTLPHTALRQLTHSVSCG